MRTGRPSFHIKARWITLDLPSGSYYYQLDDKGNLIQTNREVVPHHFIDAQAETVPTKCSPIARMVNLKPMVEEAPAPPLISDRASPKAQLLASRPCSVASYDCPDFSWFDESTFDSFGMCGDANERLFD
jgi:hypothetical protein